MSYDSYADTCAHIVRVRELLDIVIARLEVRGIEHDASKLREPEKSAFDRMTPLLRGLTYGTPEYEAAKRELGEALQHHYKHNSHHPEHYSNGIAGMSILDIVEMFCDWKAASERHADGCFADSLRINRERFGANQLLADIFENTRRELEW